MSLIEVFTATSVSLIIIAITYNHITWQAVKECYAMWFKREYWTNYNIIELLSWLAKAVIIVPGLIFGIQLWWVYLIALFTSVSLIWVSNKKLLPTLVGFNTLWVWLSCMVLVQYIWN